MSMLYTLLLNILIMFSLTIIILSVNKLGMLSSATTYMCRFKDKRLILISWFILTTILSAFTADMTLAVIITPIALVFASDVGIRELDIMIAVAFGNMVGADWTPFGGGDTIIAKTLLTKYLHKPIDMLTWGHMFWVPSSLALVVTTLWLYFFVWEKGIIDKPAVISRKLSFIPAVQSALFLAGIVGALKTQWYVVTFICAVLSILVGKLKLSDLKQLPFKAVYIWVASIFVGNFLNLYVSKHFHLSIPSSISSLSGIFIALLILIIVKQFITNSGMTSLLLPFVLATPFNNKLWLVALVIKGISVSYLTIFANSGLAVNVGYGLKQKDLFRIGLPVVILQLLTFSFYFYAIR